MVQIKNSKLKLATLAAITVFAILEFNNLISGEPYHKAIAVGYFFALIYSLILGYVLKNNFKKIEAG